MSAATAVVVGRSAGGIADRSLMDDIRPLLAALVFVIAWDFSGLDLPLTRLFGDSHGFAWREHWLTAGLMHDGVRQLAWLVFGVLLVGIWRPPAMLRSLTRRERIWWVGTTLLCIALIPILKRASWTSCPWSLAEFGGGDASYVSHWALNLRDGGSGGCFPSGHASTAFGFIAGWFVLRRRTPNLARAWLVLTVAVGLACGWVQMMRGAHYASHSLWTAWICWAVAVLSFHLLRDWREAGPAPGH